MRKKRVGKERMIGKEGRSGVPPKDDERGAECVRINREK